MCRIELLDEILNTIKTKGEIKNINEYRIPIENVLLNYEFTTNKSIDKDIEKEHNFVKLFIDNLEFENYSVHTKNNYRQELTNYIKNIDKNILSVNTGDIRNYLSTYKHLTISTVTKKLNILRSFYGWLHSEEIIDKNPTDKIKTPKQEYILREGLTIEELELVRESCETKQQRALFETFYSTGGRLSEIQNVRINDINWNEKSVIIYGKGKKERKVFLSAKAIYHITSYLNSRDDDCEYLVIGTRKPYRKLSTRSIQRIIDKIELKAKEKGLKKHLTPHVIRRTLASLSLEAGMDMNDLQNILGHADVETTKLYAPISDKRKKNAFERYHIQ